MEVSGTACMLMAIFGLLLVETIAETSHSTTEGSATTGSTITYSTTTGSSTTGSTTTVGSTTSHINNEYDIATNSSQDHKANMDSKIDSANQHNNLDTATLSTELNPPSMQEDVLSSDEWGTFFNPSSTKTPPMAHGVLVIRIIESVHTKEKRVPEPEPIMTQEYQHQLQQREETGEDNNDDDDETDEDESETTSGTSQDLQGANLIYPGFYNPYLWRRAYYGFARPYYNGGYYGYGRGNNYRVW